MNAKKARKIRQSLNYHPTQVREYVAMDGLDSLGRKIKVSRTRVNAPGSSRGNYLAAKRAA